MNFTYFKFLFINTIKRKPVWITWLLFLLTCSVYLIVVPLVAKMNTLQLWANTTMTICQTFLGMTAALFTSVLSINLFKDGTEEGTELIVVSKPISRFTIILTKFLLFGAFCLIVNVSACIISMFTIFLPRTEARFYWGLVISMLIGNLISFGIFGSIAIILTVPFAKAGVIITNIVLSLVFLIYQALTLFVFTTPARAMADDFITSPSYIITNRDINTGKYKEESVVKFTAAPVQKKDHPCKATNWQEMKSYWENDILGRNPTPILNGTDFASQVSLTYLSVGLDQYAARQAQRMFAVSRYYNYKLTNPASPEIIGNTKSMPWIYTGKTKIQLDKEDPASVFYIPASFGFAGIPPITSTRLRGYTDLIPIGYVKSKEILSQREVYLEPKQWVQYKPAFDVMYDNLFKWENYKDQFTTEEFQKISYIQYPVLFAYNNDTIAKYYNLVWHTLLGTSNSVIPEDSREQLTKDLNVKSVNDINDRFIQFKYYCFVKAQDEQNKALHTEYHDTYEQQAKETAKTNLADWASLLNIKYPANSWYMQNDQDVALIHAIEPGTQTISYDLIEESWTEEAKIIASLPNEEDKIKAALNSTKGIVDKTAVIYENVSYPREYYLFDSIDIATGPKRNAKFIGEAHVDEDYWCPYIISQLSPFYKGRQELGISIATCQPIGQNLQYFYYTTTPLVEYWKYAVIWGIVSLSLFAAGCIVYNKYDFK